MEEKKTAFPAAGREAAAEGGTESGGGGELHGRRRFPTVGDMLALLGIALPSGTEALIRVMVEAKTTEVARKVAEDLADLIKILSEKIQF